MTPLSAALELHELLGCNVFPLPRGSKAPSRTWREFQYRKLTEDEIKTLFENEEDANIAIVTGTISNLIVLDADAPDVVKKFGVPVTPIAETSRGRHYYFHLPDGKIRSATHLADGLDLKADGGYVVAPPSIHPSGKVYEWVIPPIEAQPAPPPAWLLEMLRKQRKQQNAERISEIVRGVPEGRRNVSAAALAGKLVGCFPPEDWEIAWVLLESWNARNKPPLPRKELRRVFDKIAARELQKRMKESNRSKEAMLARALSIALQLANLSERQIAKLSNIPRSTLKRLLHIKPYGVMDQFGKKEGFRCEFLSKSGPKSKEGR